MDYSDLEYIWSLIQVCFIKLHMYSRSEQSINVIRYNSSFIVEHYIGSSGDQHLNYICIYR